MDIHPAQPRPVNPFTGLTHSAARPATPAPQPRPVMPAAAPAAGPPIPVAPQVVASIPVAQPGQMAASVPPPAASGPTGQDDDLDRILEAVNNRVKAPAPAPTNKVPGKIIKKAVAGPAKLKSKVGVKKPVGAIAATLAVAVLLAATAVMAYRQGATSQVGAAVAKVGTTSGASNSIQDAGNLLVRPSDLDDYSQSLQTKINNLNDSQDFDQKPLSDQMLGI